jgi:predicted amidophosphoribosyltransferase
MQKRYVHYFGNESSIDILEAYGIKVSDSIPINTPNPKICPNCNEGNTQDARFCSKCKMIMSFDGYQEVLQEQQEKDKDLQSVKERMASIENVLVAIQPLLQNIKPEMLSKLQLAGMNR